MEKPLSIPIILGTNREGRQSEKVARYIHRVMESREDITAAFFDVQDFKLPDQGYGGDIKDQFPEYRDAIIGADGLVIVTPEYNHGYPGRLKAVLDLLLKEYIHKAVGLVGVSAGGWGGVRVIESMVLVVRELGLTVTFSDLNFPRVADAFDDDGNPTDEKTKERVNGFLDELVWMATVLRWGRENVPNKFHT